MPRLEVDLAPKRPGRLVLKNPVMTASGTFGFGTEYGGLAEVERLGAVTSKGVTLNPRIGNAAPRVCETPAGMLNSVGLPNVGVRRVIEEMAPVWRAWPVPVIVNLAGETVEEYGEAAALLDRVPEVAALELNVSSPNSKGMGMAFGASPEIAAEVTALVRSRTELPVLVKLTPNVGQIVPIARAVADAGADAISLINTLLAMAIDVKRRRPVLGNVFGGLSGPAIKPVALRMVYEVAQAVDVPIVGVGGIMTGTDAVEFLLAGATAVQVGLANMADPAAASRVLAELEQFLVAEGVASVHELIGAALPVGARP